MKIQAEFHRGLPRTKGTYLIRYWRGKQVVYDVKFFDPSEDASVVCKLPPFTTHYLSIDELEEETK